jgi:hypothetical protein
MLHEYFQIDKETGFPLEVRLFREGEEVPENYKPGWGQDVLLYKPKWDFELGQWVETISLEEILGPMRQDKANQLYDECQKAIKAGFTYNGDLFGFNDLDQANLNQQLTLLLVEESEDLIEWKTENNGVKYFTREEFIAACKAGESHKRNNTSKYWALKEYVLTHNFESLQELSSIDFTYTLPREAAQ